MDIKQTVPEWHKNLSKTNWNKFRLSLEIIDRVRKVPSGLNCMTLIGELEQLNVDIMSALDKKTPSFQPLRRLCKNRWWNGSLASTRVQVIFKQRVRLVTGLVSNHQLYLDARHVYQVDIASPKKRHGKNSALKLTLQMC
jgi:hypothetical protein